MFRKIIQNYSVTTKASRILYRQTDKTFKKLLKNHLNINNFNLRSNQPKNNKNERKTPNLFFLQNPYTWAKNKFDLKLLKYSWDKDFNENEFKIGAKTVSISFYSRLLSSLNNILYWRCISLKRFFFLIFF